MIYLKFDCYLDYKYLKQILKIPHCILFRAPFNRKNLFYEVLHKSDVGKDAFNELVHCIQNRFDKQSGNDLTKHHSFSYFYLFFVFSIRYCLLFITKRCRRCLCRITKTL
jgi:hypothetical protein